jgi:TolB-like protein/DNA-binding winged helix-turn-helix (wHTH) protein/Tfp pilus assembly protein PilF
MDTQQLVSGNIGCYRVGSCMVNPSSGEVVNGDLTTRLEPKVMEVLVYLIHHAGEVVTRQVLEDNVWTGTIVSYEALTVTINKIRSALHDNSRTPEYIETLPKKGYRLIANVTPFGQTSETRILAGEPVNKSSSWYFRPSFLFIVFLSFAVLTGYLIYGKSVKETASISALRNVGRAANSVSIAVIPFTNIDGNSNKDYFASGMTEYLITDLSRLSSLAVIARTSVMGYNSATVNIKDIGKDLKVRYVLTGSVQTTGDRLRVAVQLSDAENNMQVWADRYDRKMGDLFKVQDEITQQIVAALVTRLTGEGQPKAAGDYGLLVKEAADLKQTMGNWRGTNNIEAYDSYIRGNALYTNVTKEGNVLARRMFQRAIDIDPKFAEAYSAIALTYVDDYRNKWVEDPLAAVDRAFDFANKAIAVDKNAAVAYLVLAYSSLYGKKKPEQAIAFAERAIDLYPSYADAYAVMASAYSFLGQYDKAIPLTLHAIRLNPGSSYVYYANLGRDNYFIGNLDESVKYLEKATYSNANYLNAHLYLAAAYVRQGRLSEAGWEVEQIRILDPNFSLKYWASTQPYRIAARLNQIVSDIRKAGLSN